LGSLHAYVIVTYAQGGKGPGNLHATFWLLSTFVEIILLVSFVCRVHGPHQINVDPHQNIWKTVYGPDTYDYVDIEIWSARIGLLIFVLATYLYLVLGRHRSHSTKSEEQPVEEANNNAVDETTPLINPRGVPNASTKGGTNGRHSSLSYASMQGQQHPVAGVNGTADQGVDPSENTAFYRPENLPHKSWWEYTKGYALFFPYLWPQKNTKLKLTAWLCFVIVIFQRVCNVYYALQIGRTVEALQHGTWGEFIYQVALFAALMACKGQSGVLGSVRGILWIPVSQHCYAALTAGAFQHVHTLSLDFHLGKQTGEVLSALNKGASINNFLEQVTFQVLPMLLDLLVAIIVFHAMFGPVYSCIATVLTVFYLHMTVKMASTRADQRRAMVNADREEEAVKNDSITSYETVKYFNAEEREFERYRGKIRNFQAAEADVTRGIQYMNICQSLVFTTGVFCMLVVGAYEVATKQRKVSDFVVMITYLNALQGPLNFFGTFYRTVQQAMISGERLLELFKIQPSVVDSAHAKPLETRHGHIEWKNVGFSYAKNGSVALRHLSFECKPGSTVAFVGESGGGKSTIFRLMYRYFNPTEGAIFVDGQNVVDLTIDSVRRIIGVVPQEPILFHQSIMYNLKYANPDVSDDEVFDACRAACIHDRIMSFADGYNTMVGDRGMRLSGGEKQRVAIARTILKRPSVIMLDEATSALDSETEQEIQERLIRAANVGSPRTMLIIA